MQVIKCDICGSVYPDYKKVKNVQIRTRNGLYDTRLKLDKTFDVCTSCLDKIFEKTEAADDKAKDN